MNTREYDVLIIGAGLSGVGMACQLKRNCPGKRFALLEGRDALGGTWDLFRYPGVRSDSDVSTLGYSFRPWRGGQVLADGASIKNYVADTAAQYGVDRHIQFGRTVRSANWCSKAKRWTVEVVQRASGELQTYTAKFLVGCTGYYDYAAGFQPDFPGAEQFQGPLIHPQHWPENLDYHDKKVVVIGSGATAMSLVPALAKHAARVTLLQRSPTYLLPLPSFDPLTAALQRWLPAKLAYRLTRARNITLSRTLFERARKQPRVVRRFLLGLVRQQLDGAASMRHFTPSYAPWDQRLCVVADGDLFKAIKAGKAEMVTDQIDHLAPGGIRLKSGAELEADIIVSATGLKLQMLGGINLRVDGQPVPLGERMIYKNVLLEDVPNAGMIFGYTNLSWTLKADLASAYLCRLIQHMDRHGYQECRARDLADNRTGRSVLADLNSGYVQRADKLLPRQGRGGPWRASQNYQQDTQTLRFGPIADPSLLFDGLGRTPKRAAAHSWSSLRRAAAAMGV